MISGNWDVWSPGVWATFTALLVEYTEVVVADTNAPVISALSPTNGATGVLVDADLTITFDEPVQKGAGNIVIKESGGSTFETIDVASANVTVNGAVVTINPTSDLAVFTQYYIEIASGAIKDLGKPAPNDFAGVSGSATWSFTSGKIPTVISIDFDSDDVVQSGDPPNALGMTLPGQGGPWYKLPVGDSGSSPTITTPGGTFTFNTTGAPYRTYRTGSNVLREDFFWLTDGNGGPITWTLTGLIPGATYDIICYGRYDASYGGYRGADMSIVGYNGGLPVTQEHGNPEGDWDFPGVVADGTGKIQGTFAWNGSAHAEFGAIQFDKVSDPSGQSGYDIWASGLNFNDPNSEGIAYGMAWILGAPTNSDPSIGLLPTVVPGSGLTLHFKRVHDQGVAKLYFQSSNDLSTWTNDLIPANTYGTDIPLATGITATITEGDPDDVTVTVAPAGHEAGGKLFGRLHATEN